MLYNIIIAITAIVFLLVFISIGYFALKQNLERSRRKKAAEENLRPINQMMDGLKAHYSDFVTEQVERERNLRESEKSHSVIVSATKRPFSKRTLPPPNATIDEIIAITGINSYEECNPDLLLSNPYYAIIDKTYSRTVKRAIANSTSSKERGFWWGDVLTGLFLITVGAGMFMEYYNAELNGGAARMPEIINSIYNVGGKWLIVSIFWTLGFTEVFVGVSKFRKRKN